MDRLLVETPDSDSAISLVAQLEGFDCELLPGESGRCAVQVELGDGRGPGINLALDTVERWLNSAGIEAAKVKFSNQTYVIERRAGRSGMAAAQEPRFAT